MVRNAYQVLVEQLEDELGPTSHNSWQDIVDYLTEEGILDYDILKEVLLGEEE
jgi:hypothetical protein